MGKPRKTRSTRNGQPQAMGRNLMTAGRGTWGVTFTAHAGTLPCGSHGSGTDPWRLAPMSGNSPFRTIPSARLECGNRFCTLHGSLIWEPFESGLGPANRPNRYRRLPSRRYRRFPNRRASRIPGSPPMRSASRLGNRRSSRLETCGTPAHDACKVQGPPPLGTGPRPKPGPLSRHQGRLKSSAGLNCARPPGLQDSFP